jgi:hypothetical protein
MNKIIIAVSLWLLCANTMVLADQEEQTITLKDGSQIKGVLTKIDGGVYTVKTPIIGDVHVAVGDVSSITNGPASAGPPSSRDPGPVPSAGSSSMDQQIASSQKQLLSDPKSVGILQEMAGNPEIMQALQDPALVEAVKNHDYAAVQSNPAVQRLIDNPEFHALLEKLAEQQRQKSAL